MANELKPCPFCQRQPIVSENNIPGNWYAVAECDNSKCSERPLIYGDDVTDAKAKWNNGEAWSARPAAPVECHPRDTNSVEYHETRNVADKTIEGLETVVLSNHGELVTRSQAEAIIAAERQQKEVALAGRRMLLDLASSNGEKVTELQADNAALTARVKELEDKRVEDRFTVVDEMEKREDLETQLAATRKALEPFADHAKERVVDEPEWRDNHTVQIIVTIGELRQARAARRIAHDPH